MTIIIYDHELQGQPQAQAQPAEEQKVRFKTPPIPTGGGRAGQEGPIMTTIIIIIISPHHDPCSARPALTFPALRPLAGAFGWQCLRLWVIIIAVVPSAAAGVLGLSGELPVAVLRRGPGQQPARALHRTHAQPEVQGPGKDEEDGYTTDPLQA
jgi:hypothetical protein